MAKVQIRELVSQLLSDFLAEHGLELYSTEFKKEGRDWYLRVFIDRSADGEYISTDDCETVSRYLSDRLDELDPIEQNYYLEVSSPGIDRALTEPWHFRKYQGMLVDVKLYRPVDGNKEYQGILEGLTEEGVAIVMEDGTKHVFSQDQVAKTSLAVVF